MTSKEIINAHIEHFEKCRKAYIKASDIETANEYKEDIETFKTILQDLERLEELEKVIEWLKNTFEITLDSKLRISDGVDCIQAFPIDIDKNVVIYDLLKEVLENE